MTTNEIDGLIKPEDIANKDKAWLQCRECSKWTLQKLDSKHLPQIYKQCDNCNDNNFDPTSATSIRTFNPLNKRKVKK